jgi:hypothetical protein
MRKLSTILCMLTILLLGNGFNNVSAQTTLSVGNVVILEFNGNGNDGFSFMPLVNLEAGTVIHFTDYGWNATSGAFHTAEEGNTSGGGNMITYTAPSAVTAGTLIRQSSILGNSAFTADADYSSYNYNSLTYIYALNALSTGHDGILVFQGSATSPTFIWGYHTGQWGQGSYANYYWSDLPSALTNGTNAVYFVDNSDWSDVTVDDGYYSGATTSADAATWRSRVANSANWTTSASGTAPTLLYPNTYTVTSSATTIGVEISSTSKIALFPNPAQNEIQVTGMDEMAKVVIISLSGKNLISKTINGNEMISISQLPKGIYLVKVIMRNETYLLKFVKE